MAIRTIEQQVAAASQFTGVTPVGVLTRANDMERYAVGASGLFDFTNTSPVQVRQIFVKFGGQSTWTLKLVDADAVEATILSGTTEAFLLNTSLNLILLQGQKLKLETVGATLAMRARVSVDASP